MIKIIDKIDLLDGIKLDWEDMVAKSSNTTPFQSYAYVRASCESMNMEKQSLFIMLYFSIKENKLQAIFPLYIDHSHTLRFINDIHTDFCDAIILDSVKGDYHLWEEIVMSIFQRTDIKSICLRNLRSSSAINAYFKYFFRPSLEYADNAYSMLSINPCVSGEHFSNCLCFLTGRERQKLRQISKKITDLGFRVFDCMTDDSRKILDDLICKMLELGIRENKYIQEILPIVYDMWRSRLASVFVTYKNDMPVALKVFLHNKNSKEYISWLMFYTDKKCNQYNIIQSLEHISKVGGIYNFARGVYGYKMEKFRPQIHNLYTFRWSRSIWGQLGDLCAMNLYHVKQIVKKIIRK